MNHHQKTALIVAPYFPPEGGGLERYAHDIAQSLSQGRGWRIIVITSGDRYGQDRKEDLAGLTLYRLSYNLKLSNTPFSFGWFGKIKKILTEENPDLINIHMPVPGIGDVAGFVAGTRPVVVTYHAGSMRKNRFWQDILIGFYEHGMLPFLLRRADRIICSSDFIRFDLLKHYLFKSVTITPAVDAGKFVPDPSQKSSPLKLLFVAGLDHSQEHKGLKTLLEAMQVVHKVRPDAMLMVVGDGDMRKEYEKYASRLGIGKCVVFKGAMRGRPLVEAYQSADIFAIPSHNEALGIVILEAMACGLPVVGTDVGGIPTIIKDGYDGLLTKPRNPQGLADKIITLLNNPSLRAKFGARGREKILTDFGWPDRVSRYDALLTQMLGDRGEHIPRITVVASYFYPKIGGLENYAYLLAKKLQESGRYKVSIVTSNYDGKGYVQETIDGMTVHRLPISFKLSNTPINLGWFWQLKKLFSVEQPDIIHIHAPVPYLSDMAGLAAGTRKVVLTYHSGSMRKGHYPIDILIGAYEKFFLPKLFKRADAIIAVSQEFARRTFPKLAYKIKFIPTGVDLGRFVHTPIPKENVATYVGRVELSSSWKGIEQLLQAMAIVLTSIPNSSLEIVGGGDAIPHYEQRARELGIEHSVYFRGPQISNALVDAYKRAKVIVLPSTSDAEAFSIALIEAMASGRPIIGTAIGGTPQVITDGENGLLVPPKDPDALARAIINIFSDDTLAARLGEDGARKAQAFSWDIQAGKYSELFSSLL